MSRVKVILIAAMDHKLAIGREGQIPWHLPDDFKRFKERTLNHTVLMGSATARSIGRPLPKRLNLVLTRSGVAPFPGQVAVASMEEALERASIEGVLLILGGTQVYEAALPFASEAWLTHVDTEIEGADTWFPPFPETQVWNEVSTLHHPADDRHAYAFDFVDYHRLSG